MDQNLSIVSVILLPKCLHTIDRKISFIIAPEHTEQYEKRLKSQTKEVVGGCRSASITSNSLLRNNGTLYMVNKRQLLVK